MGKSYFGGKEKECRDTKGNVSEYGTSTRSKIMDRWRRKMKLIEQVEKEDK